MNKRKLTEKEMLVMGIEELKSVEVVKKAENDELERKTVELIIEKEKADKNAEEAKNRLVLASSELDVIEKSLSDIKNQKDKKVEELDILNSNKIKFSNEIIDLENLKAIKLIENKNILDGYEKLSKLNEDLKLEIDKKKIDLKNELRNVENVSEEKAKIQNKLNELDKELMKIKESIDEALKIKSEADKKRNEAVKKQVIEEKKLDEQIKERLAWVEFKERNDQMVGELRVYYKKIGREFPY